MSVDRLERVDALMRRAIGEAFYRVFAGDQLDLSMITVTRVETARNLRSATVGVSVQGTGRMKREVMEKLVSRARDFQTIINRELTLKYTPRLRFVLDGSLEKGDHILSVLDKLALENPEIAIEDELEGEPGAELADV